MTTSPLSSLCPAHSPALLNGKPAELLNQAWNKTDLKYRATNVLHMIERFNQVSSWATLSVLWQPVLADRVKVYERLVNIAEVG